MKRMLTLLLVTGAYISANAQPRDEGHQVIFGNGGSHSAYPPAPSYGYNRQFEIERINREYGDRIQAVWNDPYLHRGEKKRITRGLERERQLKIEEINRRCDAWDRDHRYDHRGNERHDGRY